MGFNREPPNINLDKAKYSEVLGAGMRRVDIGGERYQRILGEMERIKQIDGVKVSDLNTGVHGSTNWQTVTIGEGMASGPHYRGYLMIEPENLEQAILLLDKIGTERVVQGKWVDYKWQLPEGTEYTDSVGHHWETEYLTNIISPLMVVYGDTSRQVTEVLEALATSPKWGPIENFKRDVCSVGCGNMNVRQHGQVRFETNGNNFWTLERNTQPGHYDLSPVKTQVSESPDRAEIRWKPGKQSEQAKVTINWKKQS